MSKHVISITLQGLDWVRLDRARYILGLGAPSKVIHLLLQKYLPVLLSEQIAEKKAQTKEYIEGKIQDLADLSPKACSELLNSFSGSDMLNLKYKPILQRGHTSEWYTPEKIPIDHPKVGDFIEDCHRSKDYAAVVIKNDPAFYGPLWERLKKEGLV